MKPRTWWAVVCAGALAGAACEGAPARNSREGPPPPPPPPDTDPITVGDWTFYGPVQGLSPDVQDVSPDEGGNVYVAGGDALYVKRRGDPRFLRFDARNAGLTESCNDASLDLPSPDRPNRQCRVLAVGGASPGKAIVGFEGLPASTDAGALPYWTWVLDSGGADVVAFDPDAGTLTRTRHVTIGSPPHVICAVGGEERATTCDARDYWWTRGRRLFRLVRRIVVNHDPASPMYGDAWMGGEHGTFAVLLHDAARRGYVDRVSAWGEEYADMKDVWEHLHPSLTTPSHPEWFVNGEGWALSIDPRDGRPWGSNEYRTTSVHGYGGDLSGDHWWLGRFLDLWADPSADDLTTRFDQVRSMSHCPDGTLWVGSLRYGLARIGTDGSISRLRLPAAHGEGVMAVACDPSDHSLWIGPASGGVLRLRGGTFEAVENAGAPAFAGQPVQSIQIDRWISPRIVYFAHVQSDGSSGGVAAYHGP
ncbi:MAG TPA: hypothetical protein VEB43_18730 [Anaeromyxobacter sp.]|nr:hypothetical protein [Anaeromyxobacter sp.]